MDYSIGEFSKLIGISSFTLRYYEKEELIAPQHKKNGRRVYSEDDISWIEFIKRLKDTGMPIKEIKKYAKLRAMGKTTMNERMEMLIKHRLALKEEIEKLQEHLMKLDGKIDFYKREIDKEKNN
ncbi:MerR family transcriptional regulator [Clostridium neuense]|uniref:MerR family transcriptional regulator n=1 Tax=Clostridium neuense TaxID=1728934 RepID=A0ABW8TCN9_9CLOT